MMNPSVPLVVRDGSLLCPSCGGSCVMQNESPTPEERGFADPTVVCLSCGREHPAYAPKPLCKAGLHPRIDYETRIGQSQVCLGCQGKILPKRGRPCKRKVATA